VRGLARSANNDALLRQLGAEPVAVDLADAAGLRAALDGCNAVLHLATKIPPSSSARKGASWLENDRLRREGTNALVDAALAAGVATLLYPSVTFLYPESGERWLVAGESTTDPTPNLRSTLVAEEAVARFTTAGGRGIALRLGSLYGPTASSARAQLSLARWGVAPLPGAARAYFSSLWVDDAARAIVAALDRAPAGLYDVVDDEPLTRAALIAALSHAVGRGAARPPRRTPRAEPARLQPRVQGGDRLVPRRTERARRRTASGDGAERRAGSRARWCDEHAPGIGSPLWKGSR